MTDEKPKEDISPEENVITPEEFAEIEKREGKKKILIKPVKKPKEEKKPKHESGNAEIDNLILKTEKIEGRLEAIEEMRTLIDEKISRLSEEIGELRSALLEKERTFDKIEAGFSRIKDITESISPEKITEEFKKKEEAILKNEAKIESLDVKINDLKKSVEEVKDILSKVKSVKALTDMAAKIQKQINKIDEDKKFVSKTAGRIEAIFSELGNTVTELESYKEKIAFNEETMHELMKTMDEIDVRLDSMVTKDKLKKALAEINEKIDKMQINFDDKLYEMKDILETFISSMRKLGDQRTEPAERITEKPKPERKSIIVSKPKKTSPPSQPERRLEYIINTAQEYMKKGNPNAAKRLYTEALMLYTKLNTTKSKEEMKPLFEKLNTLYSQLKGI